MFSFSLIRWLKSWSRSRIKTHVKKPRLRLALEELESRLAPAVYTWTGGGGAGNDNWNFSGNWQGGTFPSSAAPVDLVFNSSATFFTSVNNISGLVVNSLTIASGSFNLSGSQITLGNPSTNSGTILVNNGALNEQVSLPIQLGGGHASTEFVTVQAGASLTLSGQLTGTSAAQLTKEGGGLLTLSGINTPSAGNSFTGFSGPVVVSNATGSGTLAITNPQALGSPTTSTLQSITIANASSRTTKFSLTYSPNGVNTSSTPAIAFTGVAATDAAAIQNALNALLSPLQPAGGAVNVYVTGSSPTSESFAVNFGGTLSGLSVRQMTGTITAGTGSIALGTVVAGGAPNVTTVMQNAQLQINFSSAMAVPNPLNLVGAGPNGVSGALSTNPGLSGSATWSGPIQMSGNTTMGVANAGFMLNVTGVLSDSNVSGFNLTKEGAGTLYLDPVVAVATPQNPNQGNIYHGDTIVNGGMLEIGHPYALGAGGKTATVHSTLSESGTLALAFDPLTNSVGHPQIAAQNLVFPEVQTVTLSGATVGLTQFTLSYNGVSTGAITYTASAAATVQAALNALSTINGIGASVFVTQNGSTFNVTFNGSLGGMEIPTLTASVVTGAGASIAVAQQQTVSLGSAVSGTTKFTMSFNGASTGSITYGAAIAPTVQAALSALPTVGGVGGTVTVTQTGSVFTITFGGSLGGPSNPSVNANIVTAPGSVTQGQIQTVTLGGATANATQFVLSFNGASTAPITYTATDAAAVAAALNALSTINGMGSVTVTQTGSTFFITFNGSLSGPATPLMNASIFTSITVGTTSGTTAIGFKVPNELLVLNGFGDAGVNVAPRGINTRRSGPAPASEVVGALNNQAGDNAWEKSITFWSSVNELTNSNQSSFYEPAITIGAVSGTNLTIDGVMTDNNIGAANNYSLSKVGLGRVILTAANTFTADVDILQGGLNLRDSNAMGLGVGRSKEAWWGTSLELQADGIPDSSGLAGTYNLFFPTSGVIKLDGTGWNNEGALNNLSGQNVIQGNVQLQTTVGTTDIGVAPNPDVRNVQGQTWNDLSQLTINGSITGPNGAPAIATTLTKVGNGELVLTNNNTYLDLGPYTQNNNYQTVIAQGWVTVENANALGGMVPGLNPVDQPGVMVQAGAALIVKQDLLGNNINLAYNLNLSGNGLALTDPALTLTPWLNQKGALENLDGNNTVTGEVVLNGPAGIGVETDATAPAGTPSQLVMSGSMLDGVSAGELLKTGSQRLIVQGSGTYSGGVDIQQGVLRIENDTALGQPLNFSTDNGSVNTTTTVESGAALEISPTVPQLNGGIERGLQVWYDNLVLNGTGNATFGDAALTILSRDNMWRGPVTLSSDISVTFVNALGNLALPTMIANFINPVTSLNTLTGTNPSITVSNATPGGAGLNAVQTFGFGGTITGGTFTLTVSNGTTSATTGPIQWSVFTPLLLANIQQALNALAPSFGGTVAAGVASVALNSPVIDVFPNSRLTLTGAVGDGPASANPSDLLVSGGGELALTGNNSYRGTTHVNQGILTIGNDGGLGAAITSQVQTVTLGGASSTGANRTSFTLSFNNFTTAPIAYTGTALGVNGDVAAIQTALNNLSSIGGVGGSVTVTANAADTIFTITLGGTLSGFSFPSSAPAGQLQGVSATVSAGAGIATTTILTYGAGGVMVSPTGQLQLENGVNISGKPIEIQGKGNPLEPEIQNVVVGGASTGTFTISFTNPTTQATATTIALPVGASASAVQNAINNLVTIQNASGTTQGSVTVTVTAENVYSVIFGGNLAGASQPLMSATGSGGAKAFVTETLQGGTAIATPSQWFSSGPGPVNGAETFTGGAPTTTSLSTVSGPVTSVVSDPKDPSIMYIATAGGGAWKTIDGGKTWAPLFDGISTVQNLVIQGVSGQTFQLTFTDPVTGGKSTTTSLDYNASAEQIQAAVNAIIGVGNTVQVSQTLASAPVDEVQQLTFNNATPGTTQYTLSFNGQTTGTLTYQGTPADAQNIQAALNGLSSIGGLTPTPGSVSVTSNSTNKVFTVTFGGSLFDQPQPMISSSLPANTLTITELAVGAPSIIDNTITFSGGSLAYKNVPALTSTSSIVTTTVVQQGVDSSAAMFSGAIAIAPSNSNVIYLGTGTTQGENPGDSFYGSGVYRSTDGGQTWNLVQNASPVGTPNPLYGLAINKILVDPSNSNLIYVATSNYTSNGLLNLGTSNAPTVPQAGVWRFGIVNETQQITITNPVITSPLSTFQLFFNGFATAPIPYSGVGQTDAGAIQTALDALPSIGGLVQPGNVTVTPSDLAGTTFIVSFGGSMYNKLQNPIGVFGGSILGPSVSDASNPVNNIPQSSWLNLTNITSLARSIGVSVNKNANPNNPGPDDNFTVQFQHGNIQNWSDLALSPVTGILYAAYGNPVESLVRRSNAVYALTDPATANNTSSPPTWYIGSYSSGTDPIDPDNEAAGEFPVGPATNQGNIKISLNPAGSASNPTGADILFAPVASSTTGFYANKGIQTTSNSGQTWAAAPGPANYVAGEGNYAMATAVDPVNGTAYIGGTDDPGHYFVMMLPAGAAAWTKIVPDANNNGPASGILSMTVAANQHLIVGSDGGIYDYNPATSLWTAINGNLATSQINGIATDPTNPNISYAGGRGIGTVLYSGNQNSKQIDGSEIPLSGNFPQGDLNAGVVQIDPNNPNIVYHVQEGNHGFGGTLNSQLFVSTSGNLSTNASWTSIYTSGLDESYFPLVVDSHSRIFVGGSTIEVSSTPGLGASFTNLNPQGFFTGVGSIAVANLQGSFQPDAGFTGTVDLGANNPDPNTVYVTSGDSVQTLDVGTSGTFQLVVQAANGASITTGALNPGSGAGGIQAALNFALFVPGGSVTVIPLGGTLYQIDFGGALAGRHEPLLVVNHLAGSNASASITTQPNNTIWVTKDFGTTWQQRSLPVALTQGAYISDLQVDPTNRDVVYAVVNGNVAGANTGGVWKSINAGQNWTFIGQGIPVGLPAWKLVIDPRSGNLYVGTDSGVYELASGASSWQIFGGAMPNVAVHALDLNQTTNILTAGTYGRGAYQFYLDNSTANAGAITASSGSDVWNGPVILTGSATIGANGNQVLQDNVATAQLTILGTISDQTVAEQTSGANTLTKVGTGNVVFANSNTYGGGTIVQQGALIVHNSGALGGSTFGTTVDSGAVLQLSTDLSNENLFLNGDGIEHNGHFSGALENVNNNDTYSGGTMTLLSNSTIGVDGASSLTLAKNASITDIGNGFTLNKEGTGTLTFTAANTYGGGTIIDQGILNIQDSGALGAPGTTTTVRDAAQLQLQAPTGTALNIANENLALSGTGINGTGALLSVNGSNTWGGIGNTITLADITNFAPSTSPAGAVTIGVTNLADTLTLNAPIGEGVPTGINKVGAGTLTLTQSNSYTGTTSINGGFVKIQNSNALGNNPGFEIQRLTVYDPLGTDSFQLSFNNQTTGPISFNTATATTVANALNNLSSIGTGGVNVSELTVFGGISEVQTLHLTSPFPGSTMFSLSFNGSTSLPITYTGVAGGSNGDVANIQNAINTLASLTNLPVPGSVNVSADATDTVFTITFGGGLKDSPQPMIVPAITSSPGTGSASVTETIRGSGSPAQVYTIDFVGAAFAGKPQPLITVTSSALGLNAVVSEVSVGGIGTYVAPNSALILDGDPSKIGSSIDVPTTDSVALNGIGSSLLTVNGSITGGSFTITVGGQTTAPINFPSSAPLLQGSALASAIQAALATLPNVGAGNVSVLWNGNNTYTIAFTSTVVTTALVVTSTGLLPAGSASISVASNGALQNASGNNTWGGNVILQSSSIVNVSPKTQLGVLGVVEDPVPNPAPTASPATLTKIGSGTLVFTGANTYTGNTLINQGILNVQNATGLGVNASEEQTLTVSGTNGFFNLGFAISTVNVTGTVTSGTFKITVGTQTTTAIDATLTGAALAGAIQNALVLLPNVGTGNASVVASSGGSYVITFSSTVPAGLPSLVGTGIVGGTVSLANVTTSPSLNTANVSASAIQTALNAMLTNPNAPGAGSGTVVVTPTASGNTFTVTFGGSLLGVTVPLLSVQSMTGNTSASVALALLGGTSSTIVARGAALQLQSNGFMNQTSLKPLTINGSGPNGAGALEEVNGNIFWSGSPVNLGSTSAIGSDGNPQFSQLFLQQAVTDNYQVQKVLFKGFNVGDSYRLSFNGFSSGVFVYSNVGATNAANIQAALSSLPSVSSFLGGTVGVVSSGSTYVVTFGGTLAGTNWPTITGVAVSGTGSILAFPSMQSNGFGVNKVGSGDVIYSNTTGGNSYTGLTNVAGGVLELNTAGTAVLGQLVIGNSLATTDVDTLDLTALPVASVFTLAIGGVSTGPLTYRANLDDAANIQNALNSIAGNGTDITVIQTSPGIFSVAFGGFLIGTNPTLTASSSVIVGSQTTGSPASIPNTDVVKLDANNQIAMSQTIAINDDGQLNLGGNLQTIGTGGSVTMVGGSILLPSGSDLLLAGGTINATSDPIDAATISGSGNVSLAALTAGTASPTSIVVTAGTQRSDLVVSSVIDGAGGLIKSGNGRLEIANLDTFTGQPPLPAPAVSITGGDVQVDGMGAVQTITLSNAIAGTTQFNLSVSGVTSPTLTYSGDPATDGPAIQNAIAALLGLPAGSVNVSPDATDSIFTVTLPSMVAPVTPLVTSGSGTGLASLTLPNNLGGIDLDGGSLSGTGAVQYVVGRAGAANPGVNSFPGTAGMLFSNGSVRFTASASFVVDLKNPSNTHPAPIAGADYDQLQVNGPVDLNNALLAGNTFATNVNLSDTFTILQVTGGHSLANSHFDQVIKGVQTPITNGGSVFIGGAKFSIAYNYGVNGSVVLTRTQNTSTIALTPSTGGLTSTSGSIPYGQDVMFSAVITPETGASVSTGTTVVFTVDAGTANAHSTAPIAVVPQSDGSGIAVFDPQNLFGVWGPTSTPHTIDAFFSDPTNGFASTSTQNPNKTFSETVTQANTNTSITSTPAASSSNPVYGQPTTVTATVLPALASLVNGASNPTGNVTFVLDPGTSSAQFLTPSSGQTINTTGQFSVVLPSNIKVGPHVIAVSYLGDTNYSASSTPTNFGFTVHTDQTSISIVPSPSSSNLGQTAMFNVQVAPVTNPSTGTPNGTLNIYDGTTSNPPLGTLTYSGGTAVFSIPNNNNSLSLGNHNIIVTFTDTDKSYQDSIANIGYVVNPATTQTVFISPASGSGSAFGQPVAFTANVFANPSINASYGSPLGNMTFWADAVGAGGINLGSGAVASNGNASITTAILPQGSHTIYAVYNPIANSNFGTSTATLTPFTVRGTATTTTVTATPSTGDLYGQLANFTATVTSATGTPTAGSSVTFYDGTSSSGTALGTALTNSAGKASISSSVLAVGTHTITAYYTDGVDSNFGSSIGQLANYKVSQSASKVVLSANPAAGDVYGQAVNFTAAVSSAGPGNATAADGEVVTFYDGAFSRPIGTALTSGGSAVLTNYSALSAGTHTILASYPGDVNLAASNGQLANYGVSLATTSTAVSSSVAPSFYGQVVTLTATVTASTTGNPGAPPAGTVTFRDTNGSSVIVLGTGTFQSSSGNASTFTFTTSPLQMSVGNNQITAVYGGVANFAASPTSPVFAQVVRAANTDVALVSSSYDAGSNTNVSGAGQPVTFTASVTVHPPTASSVQVNAGSVTFTDSTTNTVLGTVAVSSTGVATLTTSNLAGGTHTISAQYNDAVSNPLFASSAVVSITQTVRNASAVAVTPNPSTPTQFGTTVNLAVSVSGTGGTPTGTVTVYENGTALSSGALTFGSVTGGINITPTHTGANSIVVTYGGDSSFAPSSKSIILNVTNVSTNTTLAESTTTAEVGQPVTFTATVSSASGAVPSGGSVTFKNGSTVVGSSSTGTVSGNSVVYLFSPNLAVGSYTITATYSGAGSFAASPASNSVSETITSGPAIGSLGTTQWTMNQNYSANIAVSGGSGGYTAGVTSGNLPTGLNMSISGGTITINGTPTVAGSSTFSITVTDNNNVSTTRSYTITINAPASFGSLSNSTGTYGNTFNGTIPISGGTGPFSITGNNLPSGLVASVSGSTITITGTAAAGTYSGITFTGTDNTGAAVSSGPYTITINQDATTTTLSSTPATWALNKVITFTASVATPNGAVATGSVSFLIDGTVVSAPLNSSGKATTTFTFTSSGAHTVSVSYAGTANFQGSASASQTQTVRNASSVALTSSAPTITTGSPVTFTANVSGTSGVPTGTVSFYANGTLLTTVGVNNGVATYTNSTLTPGTYNIVAVYNGDGNYNGATSNSVAETVNSRKGRLT